MIPLAEEMIIRRVTVQLLNFFVFVHNLFTTTFFMLRMMFVGFPVYIFYLK